MSSVPLPSQTHYSNKAKWTQGNCGQTGGASPALLCRPKTHVSPRGSSGSRQRRARSRTCSCHQGAIGVTPPGPVRVESCVRRGNNKPHAYLPLPHGRARRQRETYGKNLQTDRPSGTSGCLQPPGQRPQLPRGNWTLAAANVTLVNGDAAAVSITVHQRILSPASLVGTHAATSDHFPHAAPIRRNVFHPRQPFRPRPGLSSGRPARTRRAGHSRGPPSSRGFGAAEGRNLGVGFVVVVLLLLRFSVMSSPSP